jgi:hypothetical protein
MYRACEVALLWRAFIGLYGDDTTDIASGFRPFVLGVVNR